MFWSWILINVQNLTTVPWLFFVLLAREKLNHSLSGYLSLLTSEYSTCVVSWLENNKNIMYRTVSKSSPWLIWKLRAEARNKSLFAGNLNCLNCPNPCKTKSYGKILVQKKSFSNWLLWYKWSFFSQDYDDHVLTSSMHRLLQIRSFFI